MRLRRPVDAAAVLAGTVVRITRTPRRIAVRAAPGAVGAALVAYGASLVYYPAGLMLGGLFLLAFGAEVNRAPKPPPDTTSSF